MKVISPDWVYSAWDVLCKENINSANDESFVCQFYLPIFKGLTVTASGLAGEDRQEVERSVVVNGD